MGTLGSWRELGVRRATAQSALDSGLRLLDELEVPTSAWWHVQRPALVLSRGSRVRADEPACRAAGIDVVRRGSGGGPVLWTSDLLSLDVLVPRAHPLWSADVVASYRWLGELLAATLHDLSIARAHVLAPDEARAMNDPSLAVMACYAGVSPWEVLVEGRKMVGLSQVRRAKGLLLQVGVLARAEGPVADLLDLTRDDRSHLRAELASRTIGLTEIGVHEASLRDAVDGALRAL